MQLVATKTTTGEFFRAQTVTDSAEEQTAVQTAMESDAEEELTFQTMTDIEYFSS